MRLSRKSEYAFLAMIDLTEHFKDGPVKTADICARKAIPRKYLEQILLQLKGAGFVRSVRGPAGGYRLARAPGRITLAELIRQMDGAIAPVYSVSKYFYEHTPVESNRKLLGVLRDIRDYAAKKLEQTTLADLI
jgi:Rrf2 family cysteine metabolism transcriptional repressor